MESKVRVVEDLVQTLRHASGGLDSRLCHCDAGTAKARRGLDVAVSMVVQTCEERVDGKLVFVQ